MRSSPGAAPPLSPHALCRDHPEISWDDSGRSGPRVDAAKAVCGRCPLCRDCLAYAVDDPSLHGIWGGATEHERDQQRRSATVTTGRQPGQHQQRRPTPAPTLPKPAAAPDPIVKEAQSAMPTDETETAPPETSTERSERMRASRAVTRYLDSLTGRTPQPKPSTRTVEAELAKIEQRLAQPCLTSARRLKLLQDRRDLHTHGLPARGRRPSPDDLLGEFITHAAAYAHTHQISYEAFLDFGVSAEVLDKASIPPADETAAEPNAGPGRQAGDANR